MKKNMFGFTLAVLLLTIAPPAFAAKECLTWSHPGQDVNTRSLRETVDTLGFPEEVHREMYEKYQKSVVQMPHVEAVLDELDYKDDRRKAVIDEFKKSKKQFWGIGGLKLLQLPDEFRQKLEVMIDGDAYETREIREGYRLENFLFGVNKKAKCAVFRPAPGQLKVVTLNLIEVEHAGDIYTIEHSEVCSNAGKKKRKAPPTAKAPAQPASFQPTATLDRITFHTFLLKKTEESMEFVRGQFDSRDAKAEFINRVYTGKVPLHTPCVNITYEFVNFSGLEGMTVEMGSDGEKPDVKPMGSVGEGKGYARKVCNGHYIIEVPRKSIAKPSVHRILLNRGNFRSVHYPPSAVLVTRKGEINAIAHERDPQENNIEFFVVVE